MTPVPWNGDNKTLPSARSQVVVIKSEQIFSVRGTLQRQDVTDNFHTEGRVSRNPYLELLSIFENMSIHSRSQEHNWRPLIIFRWFTQLQSDAQVSSKGFLSSGRIMHHLQIHKSQGRPPVSTFTEVRTFKACKILLWRKITLVH